MNEKRYKLNEAARRLYAKLCDAEIEASGALFSLSQSDEELNAEFDDPDLRNTIDWLNSKGLSEWFTNDGFTISHYGKSIADDPDEELDRLLPVPAGWSPAPSPSANTNPMKEAYELNAMARRLLGVLHRLALKYPGRPIHIGPNADTFREAQLDRDGYARAQGRLYEKQLAKMFGGGGQMTITPYGIQASEDADELNRILPLTDVSSLAMAKKGSDKSFADWVRTLASPGLILDNVKVGLRITSMGCKPPSWDPDGVYRVALVGDEPMIQKLVGKDEWVRAETEPPERTSTPSIEALAPEVSSTVLGIRNVLPHIVTDPVLQAIVERDGDELESALRYRLNNSASMLAGSITEAVLLDVCNLNASIAATHMGKKSADYPAKTSLDQFIDIACKEGLIESLTGTFATAVKNYRDLIHPDRERRERPTVNETTTHMLVTLLAAVVGNLERSRADGRVAAYRAKQLGGATS